MEAGEKLTLEQIRALLEATGKIQFAGQDRDEIYEWVTQMCYQEYFAIKSTFARGGLCGVYCGSMRCG